MDAQEPGRSELKDLPLAIFRQALHFENNCRSIGHDLDLDPGPHEMGQNER